MTALLIILIVVPTLIAASRIRHPRDSHVAPGSLMEIDREIQRAISDDARAMRLINYMALGILTAVILMVIGLFTVTHKVYEWVTVCDPNTHLPWLMCS